MSNKQIISELNELLASYSVFYQNVHSYHWNVQGESFFDLHEQFGVLYEYFEDAIDKVAEHILSLKSTPLHTYSEYLEITKIQATKDLKKDVDCVKATVDGLKKAIDLKKEILNNLEKTDLYSTKLLLSGFLLEQEKYLWMYESFLK